MVRPLRIEFEGALYHVMARGNARADIVLDDADRRAMGQATPPRWLAVDETLSLCHPNKRLARRAYGQFVADGMDRRDPTDAVLRSGFIGDDAFIGRILDRVDSRTLGPEVSRWARPALSLAAISATGAHRNKAVQRAYATNARYQRLIENLRRASRPAA